jgi:hypothetical protein
MTRFALPLALCAAAWAAPPFIVRVVDQQTRRGVPLVEVRLFNEVRYWTDSAGVAALFEPSLEGKRAYLGITSHGYECTKSFFEHPGVVATVRAGASVTVEVRRKMIAERLYRLTGEGIYRDSVLAGMPVPVKQPMLNAQVFGQDTVSMAPYAGKLFWIWGDTTLPAGWNFKVAGAASLPPNAGGLDPSIGVDFEYFTGREGRAKGMLPLKEDGLVWIEGLFTLKDPGGRERLLATYTRQPGLKPPDERGVAVFGDKKQIFQRWFKLPWKRGHLASHPFRHAGYWYLDPWLRAPADWQAIQDWRNWESFRAGAWRKAPAEIERPAIGSMIMSSVAWNDWRKKWILIGEQTAGKVFYAESDKPEGPYGPAVQIVEHDNYNLYNVAHHPLFNQEGGRVIYFEGTYTAAFSNAKEQTPRYDYNQLMFRLRLDDPRLKPAQR